MLMVQLPSSVDECIYFTRRSLGKLGKVVAWVPRQLCKCGQGLMEKPRDPKTHRFKLRASEYLCSVCKFSAPVDSFEDSLTMSAQYICPSCGKSGDVSVPFRRKK